MAGLGELYGLVFLHMLPASVHRTLLNAFKGTVDIYPPPIYNPNVIVLLLVLSCVVCNCCWLAVCIVVVVLCVLLSYVYLLYYVCIAVFLL